MANIQDEQAYFKERKSVEDIFLTHKPYSLRQALMSINMISEEEEEDEIDDEIIAIDLKEKNANIDIGSEIESSLDNC